MSAQPLSPAEAATVARFDAAQPAPESWGHPHHWIGTHDHGPVCSVCGMSKPECGDDEQECEHHSWAGLMELLDEHWPDDIFPTREDDITRDAGARIVSLIRWVDRLRAKADAADRVRALHRAIDPEGYPEYDVEATAYCAADGFLWPCATIDALDGTDRTDRGRC